MPSPRSKDLILAVAAQMFADRGFNGTDMRALTHSAGVNLAAVNYHFGGKQALYHHVLAHQVLPLLDVQEQQLGDSALVPLEVADLTRIFLLPMQSPWRDTPAGRLFQRCLTDPVATSSLPDVSDRFQRLLVRFSQAFRRLAPRLTPEDFLWRFTFFVGAASHASTHLPQMSAATRGICRDDDYEGAAKGLRELAAALFGAQAQVV